MALARPLLRAYSSFFSSKPGSALRFVSAKPPKPVLHSRSENATDPATPPNATANVVTAHPVETHSTPANLAAPIPVHPSLSSKEYKCHQFFSLHRPLLLLNQPTSAIFESADPCTPFSSQMHQTSDTSAIDNPLESSPDSDADAARQLAHALVTNRVGGVIAWQHALSRLGLSSNLSHSDLTLAKETAQDWVSIHADSTRRKKRKKMKKHKLRKRRRLTRRQNK